MAYYLRPHATKNGNREIDMSTKSAMVLMAAVTIARSTSFIFSKTLLHSMEPLNILAVRFLVAFLVLAVMFNKKLREMDRGTFLGGVLLGLVYTSVLGFEMLGLRQVDTGVSSFIENAAVVIVPIYQAILFRALPKKNTFFCAIIAFVGVGFLSLSSGIGELNMGIVYTIIAALSYAAAIMVTASLSAKYDPITIGVMQIGTLGVVTLILSLILETPRIPTEPANWVMILILALVCTCFGFTLQPLAQKYISTDTAAIFSALNPLSACIIGILFAGEPYGLYKLIGAVLIMTGVMMSILKKAE